MGARNGGNHLGLFDFQWNAVLAVLFLVSPACVLLTTGCAPHHRPLQSVGLRPHFPAVGLVGRMDTPLSTLRPAFRWQLFPRISDLAELDPHHRQRITAVSYEFRLWKVGKEFSGVGVGHGAADPRETMSDYKYLWWQGCRDTDPGELVHTKQGLISPEYHLEFPLKPNSLYFWSIRAHFRLDGQRRVTEWSEVFPGIFQRQGFAMPIREDGCSYPATFHLFRTPKGPDS